ncbi:vacuolar protein sorting-associated protein 26C-like isoform X2 [Zingiber officinale]|uniref:vacuolar protein sorting-associated protein 26C-like isoform X2 n=1 Tax=Zingiber officinale TaxID=94328 RepID=UPI001C4D47D8|nr:vacuolar protein sorting-associated protein 26C-like isoform X2 [Zingiber officinale]
MSKIELKLSRPSRVYHPGELIQGKIVTALSAPISYQKILVTATGTVNIQVRQGVTGVIDSLYGVVKPIRILKKCFEVAASAGKLGPGTTEMPFSFTLSPQEDETVATFYETFHGGNISIQYLITADVMRGYLHKSLSTTLEFIVENDKVNLLVSPPPPEFTRFYMTQDTQKHQLLPELLTGHFKITGQILTQSSLKDPITGEKIITDTSVIQTTQIADGDICRLVTLPIYVLIPRLLVCPSLSAGSFSIEFQVSIIITFQSQLSKLYPKSDLRTPMPWLAMLTLPFRVFRT